MKRAAPHEVSQALRRSLLFVVVASLTFISTGCAYNYAGREGRTYDDRSSPPAQTQAVMVELSAEEQARIAEEKKRAEEGPRCEVRNFDIHYYDPTTKVIKTIDCAQRTVVNVNRSPIGRTYYLEAREAKLPKETWYVLVDPQGEHEGALTNQQLMQVAQFFSVQLLGRDLANDLLVYEYLDDEL